MSPSRKVRHQRKRQEDPVKVLVVCVELDDLGKSRSTPAAQCQGMQVHLKVVGLDRHDVQQVAQTSFTTLMRSEIMMNFVQVCSIDQMSILSRTFALPILTVFTFSTPVGSVWTVISGPRSCLIECSLHFGLMDRTPFVSLSIRLWLRRSWISDPRSGARAFFRMRIGSSSQVL